MTPDRPAVRGKVAVVGAGSVGATIAYACLIRGVAPEVVLYDVDGPRAEAEALDLRHGLQFVPRATVAGSDDLAICADAAVVVVAAGAKQRVGQSRLELASVNARMCADVVPRVLAVAPSAIVLLVTNPVDVLTQIALEVSGLPRERVFGSGTVLDSSRLRVALASRCRVAVPNVHAFVVGEHGDTELALWSSATVGGVPVRGWAAAGSAPLGDGELAALLDEVRHAAYRIIAGKGATNYAIGLAVAQVIRAVLTDERRVLPVSSLVDSDRIADGTGAGLGDGLGPVCLSLPAIVGAHGVGPVLPVALDPAERAALQASAAAIGATVDRVRAATTGR
jgi:L-lactate dehydrogenase